MWRRDRWDLDVSWCRFASPNVGPRLVARSYPRAAAASRIEAHSRGSHKPRSTHASVPTRCDFRLFLRATFKVGARESSAVAVEAVAPRREPFELALNAPAPRAGAEALTRPIAPESRASGTEGGCAVSLSTECRLFRGKRKSKAYAKTVFADCLPVEF